MTQHQNDLSLLRPFNLEAAKNGEDICWSAINCPVTFVGVSNGGTIAYDSEDEQGFISSSNFRMKPLCWVENRPVYKGDILWDNECGLCIKVEGYNPHIEDKSGLIGTLLESTKFGGEVGTKTWAPIIVWSWNKPKQKVKRKVWINVYPDGFFHGVSFSKDEANASSHKSRIACVETEIEYEV